MDNHIREVLNLTLRVSSQSEFTAIRKNTMNSPHYNTHFLLLSTANNRMRLVKIISFFIVSFSQRLTALPPPPVPPPSPLLTTPPPLLCLPFALVASLGCLPSWKSMIAELCLGLLVSRVVQCFPLVLARRPVWRPCM